MSGGERLFLDGEDLDDDGRYAIDAAAFDDPDQAWDKIVAAAGEPNSWVRCKVDGEAEGKWQLLKGADFLEAIANRGGGKVDVDRAYLLEPDPFHVERRGWLASDIVRSLARWFGLGRDADDQVEDAEPIAQRPSAISLPMASTEETAIALGRMWLAEWEVQNRDKPLDGIAVHYEDVAGVSRKLWVEAGEPFAVDGDPPKGLRFSERSLWARSGPDVRGVLERLARERSGYLPRDQFHRGGLVPSNEIVFVDGAGCNVGGTWQGQAEHHTVSPTENKEPDMNERERDAERSAPRRESTSEGLARAARRIDTAEPIPARTRIVSDGSVRGTHVYAGDEEIDKVTRVELDIAVDGVGRAKVTTLQPEIEAVTFDAAIGPDPISELRIVVAPDADDPSSVHFVELEDQDGKGVGAFEWVQDPENDGLRYIRIPVKPWPAPRPDAAVNSHVELARRLLAQARPAIEKAGDNPVLDGALMTVLDAIDELDKAPVVSGGVYAELQEAIAQRDRRIRECGALESARDDIRADLGQLRAFVAQARPALQRMVPLLTTAHELTLAFDGNGAGNWIITEMSSVGTAPKLRAGEVLISSAELTILHRIATELAGVAPAADLPDRIIATVPGGAVEAAEHRAAAPSERQLLQTQAERIRELEAELDGERDRHAALRTMHEAYVDTTSDHVRSLERAAGTLITHLTGDDPAWWVEAAGALGDLQRLTGRPAGWPDVQPHAGEAIAGVMEKAQPLEVHIHPPADSVDQVAAEELRRRRRERDARAAQRQR